MCVAFEGMLYCDLSSILLTQEGSDDRVALASERVARDVVGYCEEDKWVQHSLKLGTLLARDERVGIGSIHDAGTANLESNIRRAH